MTDELYVLRDVTSRLKSIGHSEVQLRDIRQLLKTDFDPIYLERWIQELGLEAVYRLAKNA